MSKLNDRSQESKVKRPKRIYKECPRLDHHCLKKSTNSYRIKEGVKTSCKNDLYPKNQLSKRENHETDTTVKLDLELPTNSKCST